MTPLAPFCLQGRVLRGAYRFQAVITTFEMILGGCPELNAIEWRCVIIDEAHRLKNKNCKLLEGFKLMNLVRTALTALSGLFGLECRDPDPALAQRLCQEIR